MVNNHGDRESPKWGYSPPNGRNIWLIQYINRGDPNHLLNRMILQVLLPLFVGRELDQLMVRLGVFFGPVLLGPSNRATPQVTIPGSLRGFPGIQTR